MDTTLLRGDCLDWIPKLPRQSIDFIFCDPPYGSIKEGRLKSIDKMIPPEKMWEAFRLVLKPSGTVIVFGTQPFISQVICSNLKWFRYDLIWRKAQSGFLNCNNRPMREHQTIAVFSERAPVYNPAHRSIKTGSKPSGTDPNGIYGRYEPGVKNIENRKGVLVMPDEGAAVFNPQFQNGLAYSRKGSGKRNMSSVLDRPIILDFENDGTRYYPTSVLDSPVFNPQMESGSPYIVRRKAPFSDVYRKQRQNSTTNNDGTRYPGSVLTLKQAPSKNIHPFEKPIPLVEWIVKTYTNKGMTVLDPTFGGCTSGVVCRMWGRKFIGIEQDERWFRIGRDRVYSTPKSEPEHEESSLANCGD